MARASGNWVSCKRLLGSELIGPLILALWKRNDTGKSDIERGVTEKEKAGRYLVQSFDILYLISQALMMQRS